MPSMSEQLGAGDDLGGAPPPLGLTSGSASPWMTSVGMSSAAQRRRRGAEARMPASWRAAPAGS